MRSLWLAFLFLSATASGQIGDTAQSVYKASQDSVFLVYLNDSAGSPTALGSAFLVAKRLLVTNAHVADAGSPVLAVGPVRLPLKIVRIDRKNDLAILSVDVDLTSNPLMLASGTAAPGEEVFAIGNPEGLEKTISQGIVSGIRKQDDRELIQITSPISHGSSGGPILNAKSEVVGVAVGTLEDGQNLNFAVPVKYVQLILQTKDENRRPESLAQDMADAKQIIADRGDFSDKPDSDYQKQTRRLVELIATLVPATTAEPDLRDIACMGTTEYDLSDYGIQAARKLLSDNPSTAHRALLSYLLYDRADDEGTTAAFAAKDSNEANAASAAQKKYLSEAKQEAEAVIKQAKGDDLLIASFVLGSVYRDEDDHVDAIPLHTAVASKSLNLCGNNLSDEAARTLIYENDQAKRPADAEKWFRRVASVHPPQPYEWDSEGDRRANASDFAGAADAYERAATSSYYLYDLCYAVPMAALMGNQEDRILTDGRKCIDSSANAGAGNQKYFTKELPVVYRDMAQVLQQRGVDQQALEYIKEALNTKPDDPFSLDIEANIFEDLGHHSECIAASTAAIRASDGKYPWMQFRLGNCYFDSEDWPKAEASFRIAAEGDKSDAASAFDLGLSLQHQGYNGDAQQWFREALNRKPDDELRAKILRAVQPAAPTYNPIPPRASNSGCDRAVETHIAGEFNGWNGDTVYKMDDGSIWEQSTYHYHYHYAYHPQVLIYRSQSGTCHIKVEGDDDDGVDVKELK